MITATDINYSEEPYENLSVPDIHTLATGDIIIWCSGSGAGEGRSYGTFYVLLDNGKGHCKYLEKDVPGASPNQAMLDGALEAVSMIKKPCSIRLISACPLGFSAGLRGKGSNADRVQSLLRLIAEKGHRLSFSLADANVIKGWITEKSGKKIEDKTEKYKKLIYAECIRRVVEVLEENGVDETVIALVKRIKH